MSARRMIVAALSEDSLGGIATLADVERAEQLVDAHRAEVLTEAAEFVGNDDECDCGGCDTCIPRKLADGLRALAGEKATAGAPEFFQPGHTYTKLRGTWLFQCAHVTTHPGHTERIAFGWLRRNEKYEAWLPNSKSESAWTHDGWTDVTKAGENR